MALSQATATVDRNPARVKESFVLNIEVDDSVDANALDTSPLLKDFIVQRTSVSSQTSMVNFNTTRTTRFQTVLFAKRAGNVLIPALMVDGVSTTPIELTVLKQNEKDPLRKKDIYITTEISTKEMYVQQQITLTVKLHFAAELRRGSMSEPSLENANIKQIGQDQEGQEIINGQRYRTITRIYGISPQQSGQLTLQAPVFSGEIMVPSTRRSNFMNYGASKPVSIIGDEIKLNIKPIPANYQGDWLPSELLTVHQEWQPDVKSIMVGEPITRTITLTAAGLAEEQLPELVMEVPSGLKAYPDQAELHTGINSNRMVSQQVRNFALVASQTGDFELPEIKIPWWNTITNSYQVATIAAQKIKVLPNPDAPITPSSMQTGQPPAHVEPVVITVTQASWLQWLFLALWLLTSFSWFATSQLAKKNSSVNQATTKPKDLSPYLTLLAACKKNQGQQVLSLLVPWVNSLTLQKTAITSLDEALKLVANTELSKEVVELQQQYFGKANESWQGKQLLAVIEKINKKPRKPKASTSFSLNP